MNNEDDDSKSESVSKQPSRLEKLRRFLERIVAIYAPLSQQNRHYMWLRDDEAEEKDKKKD